MFGLNMMVWSLYGCGYSAVKNAEKKKDLKNLWILRNSTGILKQVVLFGFIVMISLLS